MNHAAWRSRMHCSSQRSSVTPDPAILAPCVALRVPPTARCEVPFDLFDPFVILSGMASEPRQIATAGAMIVGDGGGNDEPEGDSLANFSKNNCAQHRQMVADTQKTIEHAEEFSPHHVFSEGDVVYDGSDTEPHVVIRTGYGSYLSEVRVRRLSEPNTFTAGR